MKDEIKRDQTYEALVCVCVRVHMHVWGVYIGCQCLGVDYSVSGKRQSLKGDSKTGKEPR